MASDTEPTDDADDKDIQGHPSPFLISIVWNTGRLSVCLSHRSTAVTALSGFAAERPATDFASFQSRTRSIEPERHSRSRNLESVAFRLLYNYNGSRTPRLCLGRSSSDPSWGSYDSDARWLSDSSTVLLFVLFVRALSNHFVVVSYGFDQRVLITAFGLSNCVQAHVYCTWKRRTQIHWCCRKLKITVVLHWPLLCQGHSRSSRAQP